MWMHLLGATGTARLFTEPGNSSKPHCFLKLSGSNSKKKKKKKVKRSRGN